MRTIHTVPTKKRDVQLSTLLRFVCCTTSCAWVSSVRERSTDHTVSRKNNVIFGFIVSIVRMRKSERRTWFSWRTRVRIRFRSSMCFSFGNGQTENPAETYFEYKTDGQLRSENWRGNRIELINPSACRFLVTHLSPGFNFGRGSG